MNINNRPEQGDRFFDKLENKIVEVSRCDHDWVELSFKDGSVKHNKQEFKKRFKFLWGHRELTALNYFIHSLAIAPSRIDEFLKIVLDYPRSEYEIQAYELLRIAIKKCWDKNNKLSFWSAAIGWLEPYEKDNELVSLMIFAMKNKKDLFNK